MALRKIGRVAGTAHSCVLVYRDAEWDEYRVRVLGANASADYHTDDKQDAFDTACVIANTVREE